MKINNAKQISDIATSQEEPLTIKRYDDASKFWVIITAAHTESPYDNEKKVLSILKKNFIERNRDT